MRRYRPAAIKQVAEVGPRGGCWAAFADFRESQQGGRPSCVLYPEDANLLGLVRHKDPLPTHKRGCQVRIERLYRDLFPTDELRESRQLVFIADRAGVATEEVEIDKDRVVRTVGLHVQREQGENRIVEVRRSREVGIPDVSNDLSG